MIGGGLFITANTYSDSQALLTSVNIAITIAASAAGGPGSSAAVSALTAGGAALAMNVALSGRLGASELRSAAFTAASAAAATHIGHGAAGKPIVTGWKLPVAHGIAQGSLSFLQGKNFWNSFVSGSVGHLAGYAGEAWFPGDSLVIVRTALAAGAGAIASKATGGDAAQGAITAAIVHLYNAEKGGELKAKANLLKGELEVELNGYIKGQLSSGSVELSVDLGAASISFDQKGNIASTYGFLKGEGKFSGLGAKLTSLGIDIKGAQFTLSVVVK